MTVEVETARVSYTGAGTTGPFTIPFYFLANADIRAIKVTIADGTEDELTLTTEFTLTGAGDENGGELTLVSSLSSSYKLVIFRDPGVLQETDYPANDAFPSESNEQAVDRLTMIAQRHKSLIERSVRLPDGDTTGTDMVLPAAVSRASKALIFDASGNVTVGDPASAVTSAENVTVTQSGSGAVAGTVEDELSRFLWPEQFGAVGDGTTDDATAIQSAITEAQSSGKTIRLRGLTYKANTGLSISNSVAIVADRGAVISGAAGLTVLTVAPATSGKIIQLSGFRVTGGAIGLHYSASGGASYISRKSFVRDVEFGAQTDRAMKVELAMIGTTNGPLNFENTGDYGLWVSGDDLAGSTIWGGIRATGAAEAGVYLAISSTTEQPAITLINPIFEANEKYGLHSYSSRVLLVNPHFEGNGTAGNGSTTLYADLQMDGDGTRRNQVEVQSGYFSTPNANQNSLRVFFNANAQHLLFDGTRFASSQVIDGNSKTTSSRIVLRGMLTQAPTVNNFSNVSRHDQDTFIINGGASLTGILAGTTTSDVASIADGAQAGLNVTVTGAALGDLAIASCSLNLQQLQITAHVSAANTVRVILKNDTGGPIDLASATYKAVVLKVA
jgi:hypothetical protein